MTEFSQLLPQLTSEENFYVDLPLVETANSSYFCKSWNACILWLHKALASFVHELFDAACLLINAPATNLARKESQTNLQSTTTKPVKSSMTNLSKKNKKPGNQAFWIFSLSDYIMTEGKEVHYDKAIEVLHPFISSLDFLQDCVTRLFNK